MRPYARHNVALGAENYHVMNHDTEDNGLRYFVAIHFYSSAKYYRRIKKVKIAMKFEENAHLL